MTPSQLGFLAAAVLLSLLLAIRSSLRARRERKERDFTRTLETALHQPVYTDLDVNGHVNNTRYMDWCCNALGIDTMKDSCLARFDVNYDVEVRPGQEVRTELRRLGEEFSFSGFEGDTRHFDVGGTLAPRK